MTATTSTFSRRINVLQASMPRHGVDLVIVGPTTNLLYLTGYRATAFERITALLVSKERKAMILPDFDAEEFTSVTGIQAVHSWADRDGPVNAIRQAFEAVELPDEPVTAIDDELRFDFFALVRDFLNEAPRSARPILAPLRLAKTADEQDKVSRAGELVSVGIDVGVEEARPGMSELELKRIIEGALWDHGAEAVDLVLVQAGLNSAAPHHLADKTVLRQGEPVLIDIAARMSGYYADIAQQVFLGQPSDEYRAVYEVVAAAQEAALGAARQGATASALDEAASAVIQSAGLGHYLLHRTGHGIGLDVHEPPSIVRGDETELVSGSVFTLEPGVYIPTKFGVRIEDTVILGEHECRRITRGARPLAWK